MMELRRFFFLVFLLLGGQGLSGQTAKVSGTVIDQTNQEPLIGATIASGKTGAVTDFDGFFSLDLPPGTHNLEVRFVCYHPMSVTVEVEAGEEQSLNLALEPDVTLLQTATVSSGRYETALGETTVSLEVLRTNLLESVNATSIDDVLNKVAGVEMIDGQANIRGGSGFSFGAGSRVLLLLDDIPILQADVGLPRWDDLPIENLDQIEVVKGAASALYGSSALNGIINVRTAYAKSKPETKIATFYTVYEDPAEKDQVWYDDQPRAYGANVSHKQKFNKLDLVYGAFYYNESSYNKDTYTRYWRNSLGLRYRHSDKLVYGFNSNVNPGKGGDFFYWKSPDSLFVGTGNTLSTSEWTRFNIDPFLNYYDGAGNRHRVIGRYFYVDNQNNNDQSNSSQNYYGEYQFHRKWPVLDVVSTAGFLYSGTYVDAPLYGNVTFRNRNLAGYLQLEKKFFDKLNLVAGFRYEHYRLQTPDTVTNRLGTQYIIENGELVESKPVLRFGLNYNLAPLTYLRASWGQGFRFPTIAESFIQTNFGGVAVSPNPELRPETGWSGEIGFKRGFLLDDFDCFLDVSAFWSQYEDMIEFNFAFDQPGVPPGFQSINIGGTDISGYEVSIGGRGELFGLPTNVLAGYTYLDPQFQEFDTTPITPGEMPTEGQLNRKNSSSDQNILKYRFQHSAKLDLETTVEPVSIGFSINYTSNMEAVDWVFETLIVPGLRQWRIDHNNGNTVLTARVSVKLFQEKAKVSLIANNLANTMYSIRPGLMEAPRNWTLRLGWDF